MMPSDQPRFSNPCKESIALSNEMALAWNSPTLEPEHLVAGIFRLKAGWSENWLKQQKVDSKILLQDVKNELPHTERVSNQGRLSPLTKLSEDILKNTYAEAKALAVEFITPEIILLSALRVAPERLATFAQKYDLSYDSLFAQLKEAYQEQAPTLNG